MTIQPMDLVRIPVDDLHFDPFNPRLPYSVDGSDDQAVLEWMLQDAGLVELMGSIAVKGYFPAEPLLVMPAQGRDGYWVLEGNRRLAAVLLLLEPSRAPRRKNAVMQMTEQSIDLQALRELPCAVFQQRDEVPITWDIDTSLESNSGSQRRRRVISNPSMRNTFPTPEKRYIARSPESLVVGLTTSCDSSVRSDSTRRS